MVESMLVLNEKHWAPSSPRISQSEFPLKKDNRYVLTCKFSSLGDKSDALERDTIVEELPIKLSDGSFTRQGIRASLEIRIRSSLSCQTKLDPSGKCTPPHSIKRSELSYVTPCGLLRNGSVRRKLVSKENKRVDRKVSVMIAPSTVSKIASKFNALIEKNGNTQSLEKQPHPCPKCSQPRLSGSKQGECPSKDDITSHRTCYCATNNVIHTVDESKRKREVNHECLLGDNVVRNGISIDKVGEEGVMNNVSPACEEQRTALPSKQFSVYSEVHKTVVKDRMELKTEVTCKEDNNHYGQIRTKCVSSPRTSVQSTAKDSGKPQLEVIDKYTYKRLHGIVQNNVKSFESKRQSEPSIRPKSLPVTRSFISPLTNQAPEKLNPYQTVRAQLKHVGRMTSLTANRTSSTNSLFNTETIMKSDQCARVSLSLPPPIVSPRSPNQLKKDAPKVRPYLVSLLPCSSCPDSSRKSISPPSKTQLNKSFSEGLQQSISLKGVTTEESSTDQLVLSIEGVTLDESSTDSDHPHACTKVNKQMPFPKLPLKKPNTSFLWRSQKAEIDVTDDTDDAESTYIYDDIGSSCGSKTYLEVVPTQTLLDSLEHSSVQDGSVIDYDDCRSHLPYEDCGPGVYEECCEDQPRKIVEVSSVFYEDISNYNDSHSYEPICAPDGELLVPAVLKDPIQPIVESISIEEEEDSDKYQDHQVFSYQITKMEPEGIANTTNSDKRSDSESDGWMDVSETESSNNGDMLIVTGVRVRPKAQRDKSRTKNFRRSWSQSFREVNKNKFDVDSESDNHYEIINSDDKPAIVDDICHKEVVQDDADDVFGFDDSFESGSDDEIDKSHSTNVLNGKLSQNGPQRPNSSSSADERNQSIYGLNKIAESAGEKIKKLKRNWSLTKSDIRQELNRGFNRIRKKSVDHDLGGKDKKMSTWSLTERFRRKSSPGKSISRETSTFYLTLTLKKNNESEDSDFRRSDTDSSKSSITPKSKYKFGVTRSAPETPVESTENEKKFLRNGVQRGRKPRPTTAPPEPPLPKKTTLNPVFPEMRALPNERKWKSDSGSHMKSVLDRKSFQDKLEEILSGQKVTEDRQLSSQAKDNQSDSQEGTNYARVVSFLPSNDSTSCSSLDEACDNNNHYVCSQFADEPLYQFYTANIIERDLSELDDNYEVIDESPERNMMSLRMSAMELINPNGPQRTLWCELPEVKASGVLDTMTSEEKKRQEAILEVITSEASYLKSLNVLVHHFVQCPEFASQDKVLSKRERVVLFSDIIPVKAASENLLRDLETRWKATLIVDDIADIIYQHATQNFGVYVKYCSNQLYQERLLNELLEKRPEFTEVLKRLESDIVCQSLSMHSFLMLPMQRVTRLPLLMDAIFHRTDVNSEQYKDNKLALAALNKVVHDCNEGARKMERMEEMLKLTQILDFSGVKAIPLISASRWLVKKGELTRLVWRDFDTHRKLKRPTKHPLHIFLFTDILVVTKKKGNSAGDETFLVLDHCQRNMVHLEEIDEQEVSAYGKMPEGSPKLMTLTLLENKDHKTVEMILSCSAESDRTRWIEAMTPRESENPDEVIYESWDCPQVKTTHPYSARQPDELSLELGDVVNVLKKTADGWYQGERIRDGEKGWFPGSFCHEIASAHVRARNLRLRHRLLTLSGTYVEEMKKDLSKKGRIKRMSVQS